MRRLAGLIVVPLLLVSTAACGGDGGSDSTSSKNGLPAISKGAEFGKKPTLDKGEGDPPKKLTVDVLSKGDGAKVEKGDAVQVNYLGQSWDSDKPFDNSFDRKQPFDLTLGAGMVIKGWDQGLEGQKVGSRVELAIPPDLGYGDQAQGDIKPNSTLVFVVDVLKATKIPSSAQGTAVPQDDKALPEVGTNDDGKEPKVTIPKGTDPPKKLVSNYILENDKGETVKESDTVVLNYAAYLWKDAKQFDSTYKNGRTTTFPLPQLTLKGLKTGLVGKKVGSRVLIVIPPDQAFGEQEQQGIPKNSTLVFAVDILAKV
ncbi:FKBP-type peptidyl-prolyl cis-trans isomerase [Streptomyces sp. NPDC093085]|uniref:FKBP-type peptidyl-prolyl cis-trans isomerase n=1 Tax=Streptomyces sp. NPDC093085 TaxID=3155068 RepID=UPI0034172C45